MRIEDRTGDGDYLRRRRRIEGRRKRKGREREGPISNSQTLADMFRALSMSHQAIIVPQTQTDGLL